jgi:hypothetical protein
MDTKDVPAKQTERKQFMGRARLDLTKKTEAQQQPNNGIYLILFYNRRTSNFHRYL